MQVLCVGVVDIAAALLPVATYCMPLLLCGCRDAVLAADNEEYWGTVAAKMASMQALPGSSAKQSELGENLLLLQRLLTEDDEIDDLAYIDRAGAGA